MHRHSLHEVRREAYNYVWDNSIPPVLEVESGAEIELHVRDAGDEQIGRDSGVEAVTNLDFSHVNPVSGPVAVKGARPGDVLAVEILELRPGDWGWTAIIPGFGLLADEFPDPWLRISAVDAETRRVRFAEGITLPFEPFPGTIGVALPEPGEHSIVPPSVWGGNLDIKHLRVGTTLYLPGRGRGRPLLGRRHPCRDGRRRGLRHRRRGGDGHRRSPERPPRLLRAGAAVLRAGGRARAHRGRVVPRHDRRRPRPDGGHAGARRGR